MTKHLTLILFICFPFFMMGQSFLKQDLRLKFEQNIESFGHTAYKLRNAKFVNVDVEGKIATVFLELPEEDMRTFDDHDFEDFVRPLQNYAHENGMDEIQILMKKSGEQNAYVNILTILQQNENPAPTYVEPKNEDPFPDVKGQVDHQKYGAPPHTGQGQPNGGLSGKTVWLSPGHGFLYYTSVSNYTTQRGNTNDMVEDFGTIEIVGYYLLKYLWNAGANVFMVRERDFNPNEVIVDNDDGAPSYTETGGWSTSGSAGYNGGTYRYTNSTTGTETAAAIYTPTINEEGWYWVSVYYREGTNRSVDTRYIVNHAGGSTEVSVNQEVHGQTWYYLGQFYFDQGATGNVILSNSTSDGSGTQAIIADAVRFGGGMGTEEDCDVGGVGTSGHHRFEEGAQLYAPYMGYPNCDGDVSIRPKYAEWELSKGAAEEQNDPATNTWNSVYVSWHTNACCGGQGTSSFIYEPGTSGTSDSGSPTNCDGSAGGDASGYLRNYIHDQVIDDIHGDWDASWNDRGHKCAYFGEVGNLTTMPGALFEMGFHDNPSDAEAITTPYFRELEARAVYKGLVQFFNHYDSNVSLTILPETPTHLAAKNSATGEITLTWNAPPTGGVLGDAATSYNIYMGTHGRAFGDAIPVTGTSYTISGLDPSTTYYFRISASNDGGESFPSSVVAARTPASGSSVPILIVDGFDRMQRSQMIYQYETGALGSLYRGFLERMNSYTYMVEHAKSFESCGAPFDGAVNEAVINGSVNLLDYDMIDWFFGEESTSDRTFDATEELLVTAFLDGGGDLIVSGAEIGWDIGRSTSPNASTAFYNNYLKATYNGDDANSYNFIGGAGSLFDGIVGGFDDGSNHMMYDAQYPDRLGATGGSSVVLSYSGGTGDGAAVAYNDPNGFGVVNFGFPLETVTDEGTRNSLICNAMNYLNPDLLQTCTYEKIKYNNFENGWGIWNDGGTDCQRLNKYAYAIGRYSIELRDDSPTSHTYSDNLNLSSYDEVRMTFNYFPRSMDNPDEDFFFEWSTDGGNTYTILEEWNTDDEFVNQVRHWDTVYIQGPFTSNNIFRFRMDASGDLDYIHLDNIGFYGCPSASARETFVKLDESTNLSFGRLYPNPTSRELNVEYKLQQSSDVNILITDLLGRQMVAESRHLDAGQHFENIDISQLMNGHYLITLQVDEERITEKFVVLK